ncbi:hypothetical protein [Streptomyces canarius]
MAGLGTGAGVRYIGASFGDPMNTLVVPSYGLMDATISYDFAYLRPDLAGLKLQVNATNLFDKYYVSTCFTGLAYCGLGAPRRVLASLKYRWNSGDGYWRQDRRRCGSGAGCTNGRASSAPPSC